MPRVTKKSLQKIEFEIMVEVVETIIYLEQIPRKNKATKIKIWQKLETLKSKLEEFKNKL